MQRHSPNVARYTPIITQQSIKLISPPVTAENFWGNFAPQRHFVLLRECSGVPTSAGPSNSTQTQAPSIYFPQAQPKRSAPCMCCLRDARHPYNGARAGRLDTHVGLLVWSRLRAMWRNWVGTESWCREIGVSRSHRLQKPGPTYNPLLALCILSVLHSRANNILIHPLHCPTCSPSSAP